jgi:hypothetical protein
MTDQNTWHKVSRLAWLSGGVVAINNSGPHVEIATGVNGPVLTTTQIPTYASFFQIIVGLGFKVIGATFYESLDEIRGIRPPQSRVFFSGRAWLAFELQQSWSEVAHSASQQDLMALMDVASRLSSGLTYCEMRLLDVVRAYSAQLRGRALGNELKDYVRFKDLNSAEVYLTIHALFWELAVLRDTLAEFSAEFVFRIGKITSFGGLIKALKRETKLDELAQELISAANDGTHGWIAEFTAYRNLFTHSAPLEQAFGIAFAVQDKRKINEQTTIPGIYYPLPPDALNLHKRRSSGPLYLNFDALIKDSSGRKPHRDSELDALDYLADVFYRLSQLASQLLERSPVKPVRIELTDRDLRGPITITTR